MQYAKHPPYWLFSLPAGDYSLDQLVTITGKPKSTLSTTLTRWQVPKSYKKKEGATMHVVTYHWNGYEQKKA